VLGVSVDKLDVSSNHLTISGIGSRRGSVGNVESSMASPNAKSVNAVRVSELDKTATVVSTIGIDVSRMTVEVAFSDSVWSSGGSNASGS